ncbi:unnamed protein product [Ostreobium quekettii]|uniref:Guanylate kinase n=1 Tax=Ostreobium quekettii TaxID=121088 RepID=A0A8S1IY70_9CHLO|nr:unnamed protein product [Ostreobium quekettii]
MEGLRAAVGEINAAPQVPPAPPIVVIISGQSGVGKDSVIREVQKRRPNLHFVVTAASRAPRPGEVHGVDYLFVSKDEFEEWIREGRMLEHAVVYGEYKGVPRQQVDDALAKGTDVVLRLDVQGAATVRRVLPEAISIFLVASSEEELVNRLVSRDTESADKLLLRVETARKEAERIKEFDYVVVNREGQMEEAVAAICGIIDAEKCKTSRRLRGQT